MSLANLCYFWSIRYQSWYCHYIKELDPASIEVLLFITNLHQK